MTHDTYHILLERSVTGDYTHLSDYETLVEAQEDLRYWQAAFPGRNFVLHIDTRPGPRPTD